MGTKVVKPVLLKNVQIEGQERLPFLRSVLRSSYQYAYHVFILLLHSLSVTSFYQESPTPQSVSPVSQGRSATPRAPPHATPVLRTPTLAAVPAPAPPATPPLSLQVKKTNSGTNSSVSNPTVF